MSPRADISGRRYGRLVAVQHAKNNSCGQAMWRCECDCGGSTVALGVNLRRGLTASCGCIVKKHGHTVSRPHGTPEYRSWTSMKARCFNRKMPRRHRYGGRGITVCERWYKFENFLTDMGSRPLGMTLDRKDNDGNYEPGNCRWATPKEQAQNRGAR